MTLLSRAGCSVCVVAREHLEKLSGELGFELDVVDVDEHALRDPELREEFGDRLPVVLLNGVEHSYGSVDEQRLRADLAM
ncbi:glutaredoxin family protein [Hoyosella rhizosphaerae]|nr:glutaredoxin family protein [Hoyosella rhizosphaerae]